MHEMSYMVRMVNLAQKTVEKELAKEQRKNAESVQTATEGVQTPSVAATKQAAALPFRVQKIVVQVGEMTGVIPLYLPRYYPEAIKGTYLEGSELETEDLPAMVQCLDCGTEYHPGVENDYSCPKCKSIQGKVTQGRDVLLKEVVLEDLS